jgi:hypothetical protein
MRVRHAMSSSDLRLGSSVQIVQITLKAWIAWMSVCVGSGLPTGRSPVQGLLPTGKILKKRPRSTGRVGPALGRWNGGEVFDLIKQNFINVWRM